jgi:hypothetical protein
MAARLNPRHLEMVREKIRASVLIDRLHKHAEGKLDMTATQIKAAETLLDRSVPKLAHFQHSGPEGGPLTVLVQKLADNAA